VFTDLSPTARAVTFYLLALGMCVGLALTFPHGEAAPILAMFAPALAVLLMQLVVTRDGRRRTGWTALGAGRLGTRFWPVAVALPLALLAVSEATVRLAGLATGHLPSGSDALIQLANLPIMLVIVFFEEIGWRGYLGPLLAADGRRLPHLRTGLLHGIWHLPLVFLVTDGYLVDGDRRLVVPAFLVVMTCAGVIYGWLREASGSVYPAVLTHTAFNVGVSIAVVTSTTTDPGAVAALGRETGIATVVVVAAAALWIATRRTGSAVVAAATEHTPALPAGQLGQVAGGDVVQRQV
jgi:uncharacterized protein